MKVRYAPSIYLKMVSESLVAHSMEVSAFSTNQTSVIKLFYAHTQRQLLAWISTWQRRM